MHSQYQEVTSPGCWKVVAGWPKDTQKYSAVTTAYSSTAVTKANHQYICDICRAEQTVAAAAVCAVKGGISTKGNVKATYSRHGTTHIQTLDQTAPNGSVPLVLEVTLTMLSARHLARRNPLAPV